MAVRMDCFGATHVGRQRESNQDQFLIADLNRSMEVLQSSVGLGQNTRLFGNSQGKLLLVADGMGGHQAGERASTLAVDGIVEYILNVMPWLFRLDGQGEAKFQDNLCSALLHSQENLAREAEAIPQHKAMGTTLTMAYLIWPRLYVVHVGDSRCWLYRQGQLKQLTRDHTLQQLYEDSVEGGVVQAKIADKMSEAAGNSRHVLWNALSADQDKKDITVDHQSYELQLGDCVLLATDGLYRHVSDEEVAKVLRKDCAARESCDQLISSANAGGGSDNITVVVARFCQPPTSHCIAETEVVADDTDTSDDIVADVLS
jgi:serine/threonine protein phosphatase PrpC